MGGVVGGRGRRDYSFGERDAEAETESESEAGQRSGPNY